MGHKSDRRYVHDINDIPNGEHYAILYSRSIHIPGDERSRTNPGHGYPERTESVVEYVVFTDRDAWEAEISRLTKDTGYYKKAFKAVHVRPATIKTTVTVGVEGV